MKIIVWIMIFLLLFCCCVGCAEEPEDTRIFEMQESTWAPPEVPIPPTYDIIKENLDLDLWKDEKYGKNVYKNHYDLVKDLSVFSNATQIETVEQATEHGNAILQEIKDTTNYFHDFSLLAIDLYEQDEILLFNYSLETRHLDYVILYDYCLWIAVNKTDGSLIDAWTMCF